MTNPRFLSFLILLGFGAAIAPAQAAPSITQVDEKKIEAVTRSVAPSVVKVEVRNGIRKVATGVVIDKDGAIVTTALISPRDEEITVLTAEGKRFKAEFKGFDMETGLAVIQVRDKSLAPIALGKSADVRPGAWVASISFSPEDTTAVTQGIVSSVSDQRLRLNLWVVPGSSGSPVVNSEGRMIGVLRGTYSDEQPVVFEFRERQVVGSGMVVSRAESPAAGMALAVPVDIVSSVAGDIKKDGRVRRGWLGVTIVESDGRLRIDEVEAKSPAEMGKLREGDVILNVEGRDVVDGPSFSREIRLRKPGTDIRLAIEREGKPSEIRVKLGEYTEEQARGELEMRFPQLFGNVAPSLPNTTPDSPNFRALPFLKVEPFLAQRKYIGVSLQELSGDLAAFFGAKDGRGLLVAEVSGDSPAAKAGLKVGDVILKADGRDIAATAELSGIIQRKNKGDRIRIDLLRDKKVMAVEVEIAEEAGEWPEAAAQGEAARRVLEQYTRSLPDRVRITERDDLIQELERAVKARSSNLFRSGVRVRV